MSLDGHTRQEGTHPGAERQQGAAEKELSGEPGGPVSASLLPLTVTISGNQCQLSGTGAPLPWETEPF